MWWCISGQEFLQDFPSLWAPDPFSNYRDDSILGRTVISLNSPQLQEMNVKIPPKNPLLLDWIYLHDTESWPRDHFKELEQHQCYLVSSITSTQQRLTTLPPNTSPPAALPWIGQGINSDLRYVGRKMEQWNKSLSRREFRQGSQLINWNTQRIVKYLVTERLCLELLRTADPTSPQVGKFRASLATGGYKHCAFHLSWPKEIARLCLA